MLWSRKNPFAHVQYMGCIVLHAFYLPFIVPVYSMLSERKIPVDDIVGIFVGHVVYFFKYVWPKMGVDFMKTPRWLMKLCGEYIEDDTKNESGNVGDALKRDDGVDGNVELEKTNALESDIKDVERNTKKTKIMNGSESNKVGSKSDDDDYFDYETDNVSELESTSSSLREFDYDYVKSDIEDRKEDLESTSSFSDLEDEVLNIKGDKSLDDLQVVDSNDSSHHVAENDFQVIDKMKTKNTTVEEDNKTRNQHASDTEEDDSSDIMVVNEFKDKEGSDDFEDW